MSGPLDQSLFCAGSICGVSLSTLPRADFNKGLEQASCLGSSPLSCSCVAHAVEQHIYILMLQIIWLVVQKTQPCILWSSNAHPCQSPVGHQVI